MEGLKYFLVKFNLPWRFLFFGFYLVSGKLDLSANQDYIISFKPLTLNCSSDVVPIDELVTFYVDDVILARIKYFKSSTQCYIESFEKGQSIGGGKCNDECDCQLDGKLYIWSYNVTIDNNPMTFSCVGGFESGAENDSVVVFQAEKPSSISPNRTTFYVNETGRTEQIKCTAFCVPQCNYTWSTPNGVVHTNVLYIRNVFRNHTGNYTCTAWNILGELNTLIEIFVQYRPSIEIIPDKHPYYVKENDKHIIISCVVINAYPISAIRYRFISPNGSITESQNYTISRIEKIHNGTYTCTARNAAGESDDASLAVNVLYGPVIAEMYNVNIIEKRPFTQLCNVTANPFPVRVWWTRSKEPNYSVEGKQLNITSITRHLSDIFTCNAQNLLVPSFGKPTNMTNNRSFAINVQYGPGNIIQLIPSIFKLNVTEKEDIINITCQADCNPPCSYEWSKMTSPIIASEHLINLEVHRFDAGNYTCSAKSMISQNISTISVEINVLYAANILEISPITTVNESFRFILKCKVDSFPMSTITWTLNRTNNEVFKESGVGISRYSVEKASCNQTGIYACSAYSGILPRAFQHTELQILCSPRSSSEYPSSISPIGIGDKEPLNITVHFISYPKPKSLRWIFYKNSSSEFIEQNSNCYSYGLFEHTACFLKSNVTEADFGIYKLQVSYTDLVIWEEEFEVEGNRRPDQPRQVNVSCGIEEVYLNWKSGFNGGEKQTFYTRITTDKSSKLIVSKDYDNGPGTFFAEDIILPPGEYSFAIFTNNSYGNMTSNISNCTISARQLPISSPPSVISAVAGSIAGILVVFTISAAVFILVRKRYNINKGKDRDMQQRTCLHNIDDQEEGLKDNPMYVSSGPQTTKQKSTGDVYSVVVKRKELSIESEQNTDTVVYSQVARKNKKGKEKIVKKEKEVKDKFIEMDTVYANTTENEMQQNGEHTRKNKDGLIYADLDLAPISSGSRFVIRGLENRKNYAIIDLTTTAEPLPSDSDSEDVNRKGRESEENYKKE